MTFTGQGSPRIALVPGSGFVMVFSLTFSLVHGSARLMGSFSRWTSSPRHSLLANLLQFTCQGRVRVLIAFQVLCRRGAPDGLQSSLPAAGWTANSRASRKARPIRSIFTHQLDSRHSLVHFVCRQHFSQEAAIVRERNDATSLGSGIAEFSKTAFIRPVSSRSVSLRTSM